MNYNDQKALYKKKFNKIKDICLENVKIDKKEFSTSFVSTIDKNVRATLSRNFLEVSQIKDKLKSQIKFYDKKKIKSCHLGKMKGCINIKDMEHLQETLNIYFEGVKVCTK